MLLWKCTNPWDRNGCRPFTEEEELEWINEVNAEIEVALLNGERIILDLDVNEDSEWGSVNWKEITVVAGTGLGFE